MTFRGCFPPFFENIENILRLVFLMGKTYLFQINVNSDFFDVPIVNKIPFFRISVTIELGHSLLTLRYHELFETKIINFFSTKYHVYLLRG
jgi:hypothetical protein